MTAIALDQLGLIDGVPARTIEQFRHDLTRQMQAIGAMQIRLKPRNATGPKAFFTCATVPGVFTVSDVARIVGKTPQNVRTYIYRSERHRRPSVVIGEFVFTRTINRG